MRGGGQIIGGSGQESPVGMAPNGQASGVGLGSGGGVGGTRGAGAAVGVPSGGVPRTGRGWTATEVRIGLIEVSDETTSAENAGLRGLSNGDNEQQAQAVADYVNAHGGILGRKVVMVFDNHSTANVSTQPEVESQASCTKFTQDSPVVAVINTQTALDTPTLRTCLANARIPLFGVSVTAIDDQVLQESDGLYFPMVVPTWNRFAHTFVSRLTALGYFTGWNTTTGGPGTAPVRVGAFIHNDPVTSRVFAIVQAAFAAAGHPVVDVFRYQNDQDASNAVLKFRSEGITHVFGLDQFFFLFALQAESQHYRPRYALNSSNAPGILFGQNTPTAQNVGALGVGTAPSLVP